MSLSIVATAAAIYLYVVHRRRSISRRARTARTSQSLCSSEAMLASLIRARVGWTPIGHKLPIRMMSSNDVGAQPPSFPEGYQPPEVWKPKVLGGKMGDMNRPTAGARYEKALPVGEHALQLYSLGTPNGMKVTILLEELNEAADVEYDAWKVSIFDLEQFGSDFVAANPNSKIPALMDQDYSPPVRVFESGSILKYIAEKYESRFIPAGHRERTEMYNWLFWQMASAPYLGGGFGHFYTYAPVKIEYAIDRFSMEAQRQFDVLDKHLADGRQFICGDEYTLADMAIWPWMLCVSKFYQADEFLSVHQYVHLNKWRERVGARPAVQRGIRVNGVGDDAIEERHSRADFE